MLVQYVDDFGIAGKTNAAFFRHVPLGEDEFLPEEEVLLDFKADLPWGMTEAFEGALKSGRISGATLSSKLEMLFDPRAELAYKARVNRRRSINERIVNSRKREREEEEEEQRKDKKDKRPIAKKNEDPREIDRLMLNRPVIKEYMPKVYPRNPNARGRKDPPNREPKDPPSPDRKKPADPES